MEELSADCLAIDAALQRRGEYTAATAVEAGAAMEVEAAACVCEIDPLVDASVAATSVRFMRQSNASFDAMSMRVRHGLL